MANENLLPENDRDLLLAQQIGEALALGTPLESIDDRIIAPLLNYKNQVVSSETLKTATSNTIWENIYKETSSNSAKIHTLSKRTNFITWASAAAILIAAFIGFFWLSEPEDAELVAEATSSIQVVDLVDGSTVTLRPNSRLYKVGSSGNSRTYSLAGEAFFDVATDPDSPFIVDAEYGTVTVIGTRFNISNWGSKAIIYLEEGRVQFTTSNADSSIILEPGQSSEIQNGIITSTNAPQADKFKDWISNSIVFYGNSPEDVIAELNQHFGVSINIENLENQSGLNGTLQLESISQTLDDLGLVLGGTFRQLSLKEYEFIPME